MGRPILERDQQLAELADAARHAALGEGCTVLVHGEAGIGKSSLVEAARSRIPAEGRMLVGYCDDLLTARTLGPFRDLAGTVGTELTRALRLGTDRDQVLAALQTELGWAAHPTVLVVEDVHWADDATLDVLAFLARRVRHLPAVLLLTYRDDEVHPDHHLHRLLRIVARTEGTRRLPLARLSEEAVRALGADSTADADEVFAITGGNPFFVTEVLTHGTDAVPHSVVDAVAGRLLDLDDQGRDTIEQLAVIPSSIERWLVDALVGGLDALRDAERLGLLVVRTDHVSFRHELTRRALADAIPPTRRAELHDRVLGLLLAHPDVDVARIVHHAAYAGDREAIARYGPAAAADASAIGAHREAAAYYRLVLADGQPFNHQTRADLLERFAIECYTVGAQPESVAAQAEAVELRTLAGRAGPLGAAQRWLSRMQWWNGDRAAAEATALAAVATLETAGDDDLLALAYSNVAQLDMLAYRSSAVPFAQHAVDLAQRSDSTGIISHCLNNLGAARCHAGDMEGLDTLAESLRIALAAHEIEHACRAYTNLSWCLVDDYRLDDAESNVAAGIELAQRAEHVVFHDYLHTARGRIHVLRGEWQAATDAVNGLDDHVLTRCPSLVVQGRVAARRGDPNADAVLLTALDLGREHGELQWEASAACAAAEEAWLRGASAEIASLVKPALLESLARGSAALWPELAFWLSKAGPGVPQPEVPPSEHPYSQLLQGNWRSAADRWLTAGCRYEHAFALSESDDLDDLLSSLAALDQLGAAPLAGIVRTRLRQRGVPNVPRGPAGTTRANPAGLTERQIDVLRLLVTESATNAQIAEHLVLSVRTVDNHVTAILHKLDVHSRAEAVVRAAELGVLRSR
ncbi:ATP-binding protein [Luteipulveratus mongoliensis]|uniref:HTH luxR-type domain-containing protein n=1 Tax=Luteipulveratus mongoliensis TaxID=571913 RepID=A0A0K1JNM5_9MICO|nr:AAA family ATPase [Luteipulveratus mongoliensis]AKU18312.1 hypothetical protein VV02_24810 [Luteipulveratus mongoliensis]